MKTKKFHIADVLSITTGRLVSLRRMDGIYDILDFMTGDNLFTHQLPRAGRECKPHLLAQFPQLAEVDASGVNGNNHLQWVAQQVAKYGEMLAVKPIPKGVHQFKSPIEEAAEMVGGTEKVHVVLID